MDHIPESVRKAINLRTDAIFALRKRGKRKSQSSTRPPASEERTTAKVVTRKLRTAET